MHRLILAAFVLAPLPALAVEQRLTPAEVEAAKEAGARANRDGASSALLPPAPTDAPEDGSDAPRRPVHGEMGVEVGTGGYSAVYGTVVAPLGDSGMVAFSFEKQQDSPRYRRFTRR